MKVLRGLDAITTAVHASPSAVCIGNFDGVHRGHQTLLKQMIGLAQAQNLVPSVIVFEPQPKEVLMGDQAPPRLMGLNEKLSAFERLGVQQVQCIEFDEVVRQLSPKAFCVDVLAKLSPLLICVGAGFRFGAGRAGDVATLATYGRQLGWTVHHPSLLEDNRGVISSTRVREALRTHDLHLAEALLGAPYKVSGIVKHGEKRGRTLGYPTMNLSLPGKQAPMTGIFAVNVRLGASADALIGVASLGYNPMWALAKPRLEVYCLDFDRDVYGEMVHVTFRAFLREERQFPSLEALQSQIAADIKQAAQFFHQ